MRRGSEWYVYTLTLGFPSHMFISCRVIMLTLGLQDDIRAKLDVARPAAVSPSVQRRDELRKELASIREQQSGRKGSRTATLDRIKRLEEQNKSRMNEQKLARGRVPFKNVDEVDREIDRLRKQVDTGKMKLVEEKKALQDISALHKQRKSFAGFDQAQKAIDDLKAQIAELRRQLDDPEAKALSDRYSAITKELDEIKAEQDGAYKILKQLQDDKNRAQDDKNATYAALQELKDRYYSAKRAFHEHEREARQKRIERQKAEHDAAEADRRRHAAAQKLDEASLPAYHGDILVAEGLLRYFDPAALAAKAAAEPSRFAAAPQRTVDDTGFTGTRLARKDASEENYFMGSGGKKGKKGRKAGKDAPTSPSATPAPEGKFNLSVGVIEELGKINVEPPMTQADVSTVVGKLKEKLDFWRGDQERKTKEVSSSWSVKHSVTIANHSPRTWPRPRKKSTVSRPRQTLLRRRLLRPRSGPRTGLTAAPPSRNRLPAGSQRTPSPRRWRRSAWMTTAAQRLRTRTRTRARPTRTRTSRQGLSLGLCLGVTAEQRCMPVALLGWIEGREKFGRLDFRYPDHTDPAFGSHLGGSIKSRRCWRVVAFRVISIIAMRHY